MRPLISDLPEMDDAVWEAISAYDTALTQATKLRAVANIAADTTAAARRELELAEQAQRDAESGAENAEAEAVHKKAVRDDSLKQHFNAALIAQVSANRPWDTAANHRPDIAQAPASMDPGPSGADPHGQPTHAEPDVTESDDDAEQFRLEKERINLQCIYSHQPLTAPARLKGCKHHGCVNYQALHAKMNHRNRRGYLSGKRSCMVVGCPVKWASPTDIERDDELQQMLEMLPPGNRRAKFARLEDGRLSVPEGDSVGPDAVCVDLLDLTQYQGFGPGFQAEKHFRNVTMYDEEAALAEAIQASQTVH
eukprot:CAMPEP_0119312290 /NCGR_PEP_ID=MMETSP1333-20130426/25791_1 /TAXON_ID=418940 /ORGANISM="Scyphosphaera apsteinii, Strain RCC1455" /LENGTH=308 /DNA_ID=CAMNT_0007316891 /DNA_START=20 /DNA_END=946 /DNA_ORIENTATION=+